MSDGQFLDPKEQSDEQRVITKQLWALLTVVPVVLWMLLPQLTISLKDARYKDFRFNEHAVSLLDLETTDTVSLVGSWDAVSNGISPSGDGSVVVNVPYGPWDAFEVEVVGNPDLEWDLAISNASVGGEQIFRQRSTIQNEQMRRYTGEELPLIDGGTEFVTLTFVPADGGESPTVPTLRRLEIRATSDMYNRLLWLPDILAVGFAPFVIAVGARIILGINGRSAMAGGLAIGGLFYILTGNSSEHGTPWAIVSGVAFAAGLRSFLLSRGLAGFRAGVLSTVPEKTWASISAWMLFGAVMSFAMQGRWDAFEIARRTSLGWDASGYFEIATSGRGLYDTAQSFAPWAREPFFPWLLRAWFLFVPATEASARFFALLLSLGSVAAVFWVGRLLFGPIVGLATASFLAFNPAWSGIGVEVLRLDVTVIVLCGLIACRLVGTEVLWRRAVILGVIGGIFILTRMSGFLLVFPLIAYEAWRSKWKPGEIALSLAIVFVLVLPHLRFNYQLHDSGDPMYSSTVHTRYYLNPIFLGEPGFPNEEQYKEDPYWGEPISTAELFFKYHTIPDLIVRHIQGYWNRFVWGPPRVFLFDGREWLMLPGLLGALALVTLRRDRFWLVPFFLIALFPYALVSSYKASWRLGGEAMVFDLWLWSLGLVVAGEFLWRKIVPEKKGDGSTSSPDPSTD